MVDCVKTNNIVHSLILFIMHCKSYAERGQAMAIGKIPK